MILQSAETHAFLKVRLKIIWFAKCCECTWIAYTGGKGTSAMIRTICGTPFHYFRLFLSTVTSTWTRDVGSLSFVWNSKLWLLSNEGLIQLETKWCICWYKWYTILDFGCFHRSFNICIRFLTRRTITRLHLRRWTDIWRTPILCQEMPTKGSPECNHSEETAEMEA